MSCILRVGGHELDIDSLITACGLQPDQVWHKGAIRTRNGKPINFSGANFVVSEADLNEFEQQVKDATAFLKEHAVAICAMTTFSGVEGVRIDFGIELRGDGYPHNDYLPSEFIRAAGEAGIDVELSHYSCSDEEES